MPKILKVTVDRLHFHTKPGGDDTINPNRTALRGESYRVLEEYHGEQVHWVRVLDGWLAASNKKTGQKFGAIEERLDMPPPKHAPPPPVITQPKPWWQEQKYLVFAAAFVIGVVLVLVFAR